MKKILLIGLGRMGKNHAQAVKMLNMKLYAVCDINKKTLKEFSTENNFPFDRCFSNVNRMMEFSRKADLIIISTNVTNWN